MSIEERAIQDALKDRFRIDREVGRGGMALVYLAHDIRHDRQVAIKVLRPDLIDSSNAERFLREIRLEGRLQHPHILPIYESGTAGQFLYYVMPFVDGETLSARLARDGPLPVADAIRIGREVAEALACAHAQGVIHRDVKPANILLSGGHAVLADFGVARAVVESAGNLTSSGMVLGTPTYMSPEQADAAGRIDERSDLYSLGCVLYEMLAGEPPFTGRTSVAIFAKHYAEPAPSLEVIRPGLAPELVDTVAKTLAKVPADRFKDARELIIALDASATASTQPRLPRPEPIKTERKAITLAMAAVVVLLSAWLGAWIIGDDSTLDRNKVVVFPLTNRVGEAPDGEGVDLLVGMALDHIEPIRWISGWNWLSSEQRVQTPSTAEYREISGKLQARYYITGQLLKRPDSISVVLTLHDANVDGDAIVKQESASGALGASSFGQVALQAVRALLPALVDPDRKVDLSLISDRAPAAIAHWMQGERNYRLSRFAEALTFYRQALEADSLLVFAALKGAQAANWSHEPQQATELIERAMRSRSALPARYQSFLDGLQAYIAGQPDTALARLSVALETNQSWSEASMLMGEVHQHLLPRGVSSDSAVAYFQGAAADPGFTPPLIHLAEHAIREGRVADAKALRKQLGDNGANPEALGWLETMGRCVEDGPAKTGFVELAQTNPKLVYDVAMLLLPGAQQSRCARAAFEALLTTDAWSTGYSWPAAQALQGLMLVEGKLSEATTFLTGIVDSGTQSENPNLQGASTASLFLAVLNAAAGSPMPALTARTELFARERYGEAYQQVRGVTTPWVLGNLSALKGDRQTLAHLRDFLAQAAAQPANPQAANARARGAALSARLLLLDRDTLAAIAELERIASIAPQDAVHCDLAASLAPERLLLARLYLNRRQYKQAHDAAAAFDHFGAALVFLPYVPQSLQIRLQAARALRMDRASVYTRRLQDLGRVDLIDRAK